MVRPRIGSMGDLLVEIMAEGRNGRHLRVETYKGPFPSGSPGIFIGQAARLGGGCIFVGAVGDDAFGQVILNRLRQDGVDTSLVNLVQGVPTGTAFVSYNDDGSRDFVFNITRSAAALFDGGEAVINALLAFNLDCFHVSGTALSNEAMCASTLQVCRALHLDGVKISFDPNVRKELMGNQSYLAAVQEMMGMCSIFLPSEDDAAMLFPVQRFAHFARPLLASHMDYVVLKKGADGCEAMDRAGVHLSLPAITVEAVDPTGAGDCFCAAFVTLTADKLHSFPNVLARANAAGALAVTKLGPMEGSGTLPQIEKFMAAQS
jgi:sugar/nucleoside kinase (ribokinase family)